MQSSEDASFRSWRLEIFEERLAFSVEPVVEGWLDPELGRTIESPSALITPLAAEGHGWTDVAQARQQLGLRGGRQTVAIIDSGIAYDHVALGGGLGRAYRVVGGWDFAENDPNPYDDGPAGYHGTHVAGIVGAQDARYAGVAPDVDLVALRVFDDQGNGNLAWVEQALQWVARHRTDFEFPITTVNLSLGVEWNSTTLPGWTTLEDEFQQLTAAGVYISVAAGNSFQTFGTPGLSYPAASPYVTPVASIDASGNLSRFSQRSDRVLAAPGERIRSTLPDHFFGSDGVKNDWGASSGTSMAAPYVAGASVLVREAMENLGINQITQGTINDLFRRTADSVYDAVTRASYARLNLGRALETLVGADDFGASASTAGAIGKLTTTIQVGGTLGRLDDVDYFQFVAGASGSVTLSLTGPAALAARWKETAGGRLEGNRLLLDVAAGQTYVVGIAGGGTTIGKYHVDLRLTPATGTPAGPATPTGPSAPSGPSNPSAPQTPSGPAMPDSPQVPNGPVASWGTVAQTRIDGLRLAGGGQWFQATAGASGRFTFEAFAAAGPLRVEIYNSQRQLLATAQPVASGQRADLNVLAGQTLLVRLEGTGELDVRLTNLLTVTGARASVAGTAGADTFRVQAGPRPVVDINGVQYELAGVTRLTLDGRGGQDAITLVGGAAPEAVSLRPGGFLLSTAGYQVSAVGMERVHFVGTLSDAAVFYDSAGNDAFEYAPGSARMTGPGYENSAEGAGSFVAYASAGLDAARLRGTSGNDSLYVSAGSRWLTAGGLTIRAEGFEHVDFVGGGGTDQVRFYSSSAAAQLSGRRSQGTIAEDRYTTQFAEIESLLASVRTAHRLTTDLEALDFVFQRIGRR